MSNTSTVTPYVSSQSTSSRANGGISGTAGVMGAGVAGVVGVAALGVGGLVIGAAALARWLAEETPEGRAAVERAKEERARRRADEWQPRCDDVIASVATGITSVELGLFGSATLVQAATQVGYMVASPSIPMVSALPPSVVCLQNDVGERLMISAGENGRMLVHAHGGHERIRKVVRQHTVNQALDHMKGKGMAVEATTLANGELQIVAREQGVALTGQKAKVTTKVGNDGTAEIDVDCVKGRRCEQIVSEIAEAVGGIVTSSNKKASYFQLPGESAKTRVKIGG